MDLGFLQAPLESNSFQNGTSGFTNGFDSGSESFPAAGSNGLNNGRNITNQRANRTFVALHHQTPNNETYWDSHFNKLLFRFVHPDKKNNDDFLNFWKSACRAMPHGGTKQSKIFEKSPSPFCFMYTVPQINYLLAVAQMRDGIEFQPKKLWEWFRPIGVDITEESTQDLYDNSIGDHREMTVIGPARTCNVWGNVSAGDQLYILIKPILVDVATRLKYRTTIDGQEVIVENKPPYKGKPKEIIWQFCNYSSESFPRREDISVSHNKVLYTGTLYKIGSVKDNFVENHSVSLLSGFYKNVNDYESNVNRDELAVTTLPHINIFVDPFSPMYF